MGVHIVLVIGTRPELIKLPPLARAMAAVAVLLGALGTTAQGASRWIVQETVGADLGPGLVALAGIAVIGLLGAVLGGVWGMRYHRSVDTWTMSNAWK